jgi:hypothetical protein
LQDVLLGHRETLAAQGVDYIPLTQIRLNRIPDLRRRNWRAWVGGAPLRAEALRKLAPLRTGADTLVMSEEDWIGPSQDGLEPTPYPQIGRRIGALSALAGGGARLFLFLSTRSWEAFLPADYATVLRFQPYPGGFEAIRARVLARPPSWVDVVERICAAAPRATLRLWRYESYRAHSAELAAALCGRELGPLPQVADPVRTRTPSAEAIAEVERLDPAMPLSKRRTVVRRLFEADIGAGGAKFTPFSEDEQRRLQEAYREQVAEIERRYPGLFLV